MSVSARILIALVVALGAAGGAVAQTAYPTKPIRLIVPFAAGGATDIIARLVGGAIAEQVGQPVVIENRTGAGGNIGTEAIARAAPDGYTIGICGASTTIAPAIGRTPYDVPGDFTAIGTMTSGDNILLVPAASPAKSTQELIALLKQKGDRANYASAAVGGSTHLATELFKIETGTQAVHIPFRGSAPALVELIAGRVDLMFDNIPAGLPHIRSGAIRALATTGPRRNPALPDTPTLRELGINVEVTSWTALCGPAGLPRSVVDRLNAEIGKALDRAEVGSKLAEFGQAPLKMAPDRLQERLASEVARWKRVAEIGRIKAE